VPAGEVTALRAALRLKQSELARRLGVTRRTVIRGEQRGLEIPSTYDDSPRKAVGEAWRELKAEAAGALALQAKDAELAKRRRQNREAAQRYRKRRRSGKRVTVSRRSRVTKRPADRRKSDSFQRIPRKLSPRSSKATVARRSRKAGRRRGRK
jgi:transcriptional regulator with XRE-family HTH domain